MTKLLYSIVDSPTHPNFTSLYKKAGFTELKLHSIRKAISELKKQPPEVVVAEFMYGYANNYAGVNISNLDVFLYSLQKYAPQAKVVVFVTRNERQYVDKLSEIVPLHAVLQYPVSAAAMSQALSDD